MASSQILFGRRLSTHRERVLQMRAPMRKNHWLLHLEPGGRTVLHGYLLVVTRIKSRLPGEGGGGCTLVLDVLLDDDLAVHFVIQEYDLLVESIEPPIGIG